MEGNMCFLFVGVLVFVLIVFVIVFVSVCFWGKIVKVKDMMVVEIVILLIVDENVFIVINDFSDEVLKEMNFLVELVEEFVK